MQPTGVDEAEPSPPLPPPLGDDARDQGGEAGPGSPPAQCDTHMNSMARPVTAPGLRPRCVRSDVRHARPG
eukprot:6973456-Prymnesium_polylepis.1